jgi:hypothetical protein
MRDRIHFHFHRIRRHPNRWLRNGVGAALVLGGLLGPVVPVLGVWMLPLGTVLLAEDLPWVRRVNRRATVWWGRCYGLWKRRGGQLAPKPSLAAPTLPGDQATVVPVDAPVHHRQ